MPAELLSNIVWTGPSVRARRLSVVPVSVATHVAVALLVLFVPLVAEVELPPVAPLGVPDYMVARAVPGPPPPAAAPAGTNVGARRPSGAPIAAPPAIVAERAVTAPEFAPPGVGVVGGIGSGDGTTGGLGLSIAIAPPPPPPRPASTPVVRRVGGDIREPRRLVTIPPIYPDVARSGHVEGVVMLEAVINVRGEVEQIRVVKSVPLLDQAAIDAVQRWRYTPTLLNGTPIPVLLSISVTFRIQ